ncbi:MAG: FAD-dependent oxidoreductase [Desulfovibrionaceae bacterium]|nr:FAD-dependent oxidoreductase [Desulfovibrionaceae bacterium]
MKRRVSCDLLIVGAGLIGCSVAFGLAQRGFRPVVIDGSVGFDASRASIGLIWTQGKGGNAPEYADWTLRSAAMYPDFIRNVETVSGQHIPFSQTGGLAPLLGDREAAQRIAFIQGIRNQLPFYPSEFLDRTELERLLPKIHFGREVSGASFSPGDGLVSVLDLLHALQTALLKSDIPIFRHESVLSVHADGAACLIETDQTVFEADRAVLAAGLGNIRLCRDLLPQPWPVFPEKGSLMLLERMPPVSPIPLLGATQTASGTILIGLNHEKISLSPESNIAALAADARRVLRIWPDLGRYPVLRSWSGLRIIPAGGLPLYASFPHHPRILAINTHSAVTLAAIHAHCLPDWILRGNLDAPESAKTLFSLQAHLA